MLGRSSPSTHIDTHATSISDNSYLIETSKKNKETSKHRRSCLPVCSLTALVTQHMERLAPGVLALYTKHKQDIDVARGCGVAAGGRYALLLVLRVLHALRATTGMQALRGVAARCWLYCGCMWLCAVGVLYNTCCQWPGVWIHMSSVGPHLRCLPWFVCYSVLAEIFGSLQCSEIGKIENVVFQTFVTHLPGRQERPEYECRPPCSKQPQEKNCYHVIC